MSDNKVAIRLSSIAMRFDHKEVLKNVNIDIHYGDFVAITGPNGGGKTTLLRIMLKLLEPSEGEVEYLSTGGTPYPLMPIGYLPQKSSVDSRFPITVKDVVRLGLMGPMAPKDDYEYRVDAMISELELREKNDSPIGMISGGQLQRTLIGRALVAEPEVIVLDEPLSYLDMHFKERLFEMLESRRASNPNTIVILVTHEMSTLASMANRHIIVEGAIREVSVDA